MMVFSVKFYLTSLCNSQQVFHKKLIFSRINKTKEKSIPGSGVTAVYMYYNINDNRNYLVLRMFRNIKSNDKRLKRY